MSAFGVDANGCGHGRGANGMEADLASASARALVLALDLSGTVAFALLGSLAAARRGLDVFGVLVVAFASACSGGILRDVLIGATPPAAFTDWRYLAAAMAAGLAVFVWGAAIEKVSAPILLVDAAGLALFCVAGAQKALAFGLSPPMAALMGMLTGIGGGVVRDVLLAEVPSVLKPTEIYAVAALAGAVVVVTGAVLSFDAVRVAIAGGLVTFALRVLAIRFAWRLPVAPWRDGP